MDLLAPFALCCRTLVEFTYLELYLCCSGETVRELVIVVHVYK